MAILYKNLRSSIINSIPLITLYYLSISEIDTHFSNMFEILSFNLQIIIIYYWMLKNSSVLGNGHIFFAGIINDAVMGSTFRHKLDIIPNCFFRGILYSTSYCKHVLIYRLVHFYTCNIFFKFSLFSFNFELF